MTALVTGGSRGIGAACARALAAEGFDIILHYNKSEQAALAVQKDIEALGRRAFICSADFSSPAEVTAFCRRVLADYGCPQVVVNNAGISLTGLIQDMDDAAMDSLININLKAVMIVCRELVPAMVEAQNNAASAEGSAGGNGGKNPRNACIINVSSMWGQTGASFETVYSAVKGGVDAFTKALAKELGPSGIRVNAVSPGCILTDMCSCYSPAELQAVAEESALQKNGTAEDIAAMVAFLASDRASYITGQIIGVNGGLVI